MPETMGRDQCVYYLTACVGGTGEEWFLLESFKNALCFIVEQESLCDFYS